MKNQKSFTLTIVCTDQAGIVATITSALFEAGANITEANQFEDHATGQFFMRVVFDVDNAVFESGGLHATLQGPADKFNIDWKLRAANERKKVLILVSKQDHCLGDLLYRTRIGELSMNIVGIVSNHPREVLHITDLNGVPYHHLPVTPASKPQQEKQIKAIVEESGAELVILARYMQILSDDLTSYLAGRCVNIHHSFLPAFKGAKPYHQAYDRGVKVIGATAHLVTTDLDEGPIIEQDVEHINHADTPNDMVRKGTHVERRVLAKAVMLLLEDRVLLNGSKTVVFRN
jgi:formyltetrahydrofolate deformylase